MSCCGDRAIVGPAGPAGPAGPEGPTGPAGADGFGVQYGFGATGFPASSPIYLAPWYQSVAAVTTLANAGQLTILRTGTLQNFKVRHGNPGGASNLITYTVFLNGAATGITLVLNVTGTLVSNGGTLAVTVDDALGLQAAQATPAVVSPRPVFQCEWVP
jgi:hypothetical protein